MLVLGVDPGLAHTGICLAEVDAYTIVPLDMQVFQTKKDQKAPYVSADNDRRCGIIADATRYYFQDYPIKVLAIEAMSFPRSSSAAAKAALARGAIVTQATLHDIPIIECRPHDIKIQVAGIKGAPKKLIQSILEDDYPQSIELSEHIANSRKEHPFDALAAIVTLYRKGELATWV